MQPLALTVDRFLDHAAKWHGAREVVWVEAGETRARVGYAELRARANRLSGALAVLGLRPGGRVGTLAWNTQAHLEIYYGVMGTGAVCHTLNPRLTAAQLAAMVNEADDRMLAVAADLVPLAEQLMGACPGVERLIVLDAAAAGRGIAVEALLAEHGATTAWGGFDENVAAGLCYTSGTTGRDRKSVV